MSQELYTFTGVMCPQCKRLRNVTFKAKARTNGDLLLGLPSVDSRKILKEHLKKLCSVCDGSYTAKDELACRIGTRLHSAADSLRPDAIKETYKSGWDSSNRPYYYSESHHYKTSQTYINTQQGSTRL